MDTKRSIGITVFGWIFIIIAILFLIRLPGAVASHKELKAICQEAPLYLGPWLGVSTWSLIGILWKSLLFLIAGIGILKLRPWARYLVLLLMIGAIIGIFWNILLFGPQIYYPLQIPIWLFIFIFAFLFFLKQSVKEQFEAEIGIKKIRLAAKIFIGLVLIPIGLQALAISLWFGGGKTTFQKSRPVLMVEPQKVEYVFRNREYLLNECRRVHLFGYSIYLPNELRLSFVRKGEFSFGWNLSLVKMEDSDLKIFMLLDSKSLGDECLLPLSRTLKFKSGYEFERRLSYPGWSPIYLIMKALSGPMKKIEDVTTPSWRGFIKVHHLKDKARWTFTCSAYSLKGKTSGGISLVFKEGEMTLSQARDIIASLRFEETQKDDLTFFNAGKAELSINNYTDASINFINALYMNDQNPEYSYYLAYSLFEEDDSQAGMRARLGSSNEFLEYALKLNPDYQEAKDLLISVNNKIQQIEKERDLK